MSPSSCEINPNRSLERACGNRELSALQGKPFPRRRARLLPVPRCPWQQPVPGLGLRGLRGGKPAGSAGMSPTARAAAGIKSLGVFLCQEGGAALEADGEGCRAGAAASTRAELRRSRAGRRRAWAPPSIPSRTCISTSLGLGSSCLGLWAAARRELAAWSRLCSPGTTMI